MAQCKRMTVNVYGIDAEGALVVERNRPEHGECLNIPGKCGCTHAEIMLLRIMPNPVMVLISHSPCKACAEALVSAGVKAVYWMQQYRLTEGIEVLRNAGVTAEPCVAGMSLLDFTMWKARENGIEYVHYKRPSNP